MGKAIYTKAEREQMDRQAGSLERKYKTHPAADHFPMLDETRFDELVASVRRDGLIDPIILLDGMILDGRNRLRACSVIGMEPRFEMFAGDNPFDYVESKNIERRDLEPFQRETIRLLIRKDSREWDKKQRERDRGRKQSEAASSRDRPRRDDGTLAPNGGSRDPQVGDNHAKERHGDRHAQSPTTRRAQSLIDADPEKAKQVAAGEVKGMQALRQIKRATVSQRIAALPAGKFRLIYADPPWKYGDEREGLEKEGTAAAAQYPTMPTSAICEFSDGDGRHVSDLAASDAVLFMWATFPLLEDAIQVIKAWKFNYKTAFVWDKQRSNIGNYHDARAELLMIATRGSCPIEIDTRPKQVQSIARGKHSAKPEEFRSLVESLYPSSILAEPPFRAVELFRRGVAPAGWVVWGNESEVAA
jgi:N6-adenosine-specific RNA methylase IME4